MDYLTYDIQKKFKNDQRTSVKAKIMELLEVNTSIN